VQKSLWLGKLKMAVEISLLLTASLRL